jgi:hypothetical protein
MRKVLLLLFSLIIFQIPAFAINKKMPPSSNGENNLPNIFIYKIPDTKFVETTEDADAAENEYVQEKPLTSADNSDEEIALNVNAETDDDIVLGATVLKGYAEYIEDTESIYLKDDNNNFVLNLKVPQKISGSESLDLSKFSNTRTITRHTPTEYNIAPQSITAASKKGDFTIGALYGNEVDNIAMLESETGLFTKYEKDKFAVSSSFKKSLNTTYAQDYNTISVTPELKLNSYISLKNKLSADITRNRRSTELIFSLNPFGKKDKDRMLLEAGAKQTYYVDTGENKTQLNFSATFKL